MALGRRYGQRKSGAAWGIFFLAGTGILWGTIGVVSKQIARDSSLDSVSITWLRAVIASPVCVFAAWVALGPRLFSARRRDLRSMILLGAVLILYQWFYLAAIDRIGVSAATLISLCGAPVIVTVASGILLHESLAGPVWVSLAGAVSGTALLIGTPDTGNGRDTVTGVLLAAACAAGIAGHVLGLRSIAHRVHPLQPLAIGFPVGAIVFAPIALSRGVEFSQNMDIWAMLVYLGVAPSAVAYLLYQRGLQEVPASMATIVTMIEPLVAAVLAWILFDERLGIWGWIGGALLLGSLGLLSLHTVAMRRNMLARATSNISRRNSATNR